MKHGAPEVTLPRIGNSLVQTNLEHYLVNICFKNGIKTQEQLFFEIRRPYSHFMRQLAPSNAKKLITAFFSLN